MAPVEPEAVLPFYQRKGFVCVMIAMTLLAIGIVAGVLLSSNSGKNTGGATTGKKAPSDDTLVPVPEDPITGQTALNSPAPSSALDMPEPTPSLAPAALRTPVPTMKVPARNPNKNPA